jgi:hypothetical protein
MRVNRDDSSSWYQADPETVRNTAGGIQHGASAVQNLRAIGEDAAHAVVPVDRAIAFGLLGAKLHWIFALPMFIAGLFADLLELVLFPFMLLKNLGDMAAHGIGAAVNAAQGERDGEVDVRDIRAFDPMDDASVQRQANPPYRSPLVAPTEATGVKVGGASLSYRRDNHG